MAEMRLAKRSNNLLWLREIFAGFRMGQASIKGASRSQAKLTPREP